MLTDEAGVKATKSVLLPPAACIGWIPFFKSLDEMQDCAFKAHPHASASIFHPAPFRILFWTGNKTNTDATRNPSSAGFSDASALIKFAESKNYRAILAPSDIRVWFDKRSRPVKVDCSRLAITGFTPVHIPLVDKTIHMGGRGDWYWFADVRDDGTISIVLWGGFKLGRVADFGCMVLTHSWAPSAVLMIEYTLNPDLSGTITYAGTAIPTQTQYHNLSRTSVYDMLNAVEEEIDGFFDAGGCVNAPIFSNGHENFTTCFQEG